MNQRFHLLIDGRTVAMASEVSGLDAGPGQPLTLKRVVARDFETLCKTAKLPSGRPQGRGMFLLLRGEHQVILAFAIRDAWISKYDSPMLGPPFALESITLENSLCLRLR